MTTGEFPETVVFDAEPLIAYFCDETGSDTVEEYIEAVTGTSDGCISKINLAEVHYIVRYIDGEARANTVVDIIEENGIVSVDVSETWSLAADVKYRYSPSLADAFALATATHMDGLLLAGADDDWDDPIADGYDIERFRTEPA